MWRGPAGHIDIVHELYESYVAMHCIAHADNIHNDNRDSDSRFMGGRDTIEAYQQGTQPLRKHPRHAGPMKPGSELIQDEYWL